MKAVEELLEKWNELHYCLGRLGIIDYELRRRISELKAAIEADRATSNPAAGPDQQPPGS